jgi:hypothetical protein
MKGLSKIRLDFFYILHFWLSLLKGPRSFDSRALDTLIKNCSLNKKIPCQCVCLVRGRTYSLWCNCNHPNNSSGWPQPWTLNRVILTNISSMTTVTTTVVSTTNIILIIIIIMVIITIIIIIIIRHELGLDRPVSASSNSLFKGLPSRPCPFCL